MKITFTNMHRENKATHLKIQGSTEEEKNTLVVEVKQGCKNIRGMKDINEVTHFTCHVVMPKKEKCFII